MQPYIDCTGVTKAVIKFKINDDDTYESLFNYKRYFKKYDKWLYIQKGFISEGATNAPDIESDGWWWHDMACRYQVWSDGTALSDWQASELLHYIMKSEGHTVRSTTWQYSTFVFRYIKHKIRDLFK